MATQEVRIHEDEGKPSSYVGITWDKGIMDVFAGASEPLRAFLSIMEDVSGDMVPDEGHPVLCAKVLEALLEQQRRVMAQAVECVHGQVGKIVVNAHNYSYVNQQERIAGQYCAARIVGKK